MQTVQFTMGMGSLKSPQKVRRYVLDWFRHLMTEQGICADNVSSGKFVLTLGHNDNNDLYNYDELYKEITSWAKSEFNIEIELNVYHGPNTDLNQFDFLATVPFHN